MSESSIWNKLRNKGFSETATAAIMGNMQAESGLIPYRLQGDFAAGFQKSLEYTARVDSGAIGKSEFMYNGPGGGGYGLCQWTYPTRKAGLYDLAKSRGVSVGDEQLGIDWFCAEIRQGEYSKSWNTLNSDAELWDMVKVLVTNFERPADQSDGAINARTRMAKDILVRNSGSTPDPEPAPEPTPTPEPIDSEEIIVPVLKFGDKDAVKGGDKGVAIAMFQHGLEKRGYDIGIWGCDGHFGRDTEGAVKQFQSDSNLAADGVVGQDTWQVMFQ